MIGLSEGEETLPHVRSLASSHRFAECSEAVLGRAVDHMGQITVSRRPSSSGIGPHYPAGRAAIALL